MRSSSNEMPNKQGNRRATRALNSAHLKRCALFGSLTALIASAYGQEVLTHEVILHVLNDPQNDEVICNSTRKLDAGVTRNECLKSSEG